MQKQEEKQPQNLPFKLSCNNSVLTISDGTSYDVSVDYAFTNLFEKLPKEINPTEIKTEILGILDDFTEHLPENYSMGRFKVIYAFMNSLADFHFALLIEKKGGSHD